MDYTPRVLRNHGVPVPVAVLDEQGKRKIRDDYEPAQGDDPAESFVTERRYARVDFNLVADLENAYLTTEGWQTAMAEKPASTVRHVFALMWGCDEREVGERMLPGHMDEYSTAIGVAWALANGVDPFLMAEALKESANARDAVHARGAEVIEEALKVLATLETGIGSEDSGGRGDSTSPHGSEPDVP